MYHLLKKILKTGNVTRKDPFKAPPVTYRGTIAVQEELCIHCETCVNICPVQAMSYQVVDDSFALLKFDYTACMYCGLCVENCPGDALYQTNRPKSPKRSKEGLIESFYLSLPEDSR